jgi:hypothetical protein
MTMALDALKEGLAALGLVLNTLKQAKDLMPQTFDRVATEKALAAAETQLKIAEAQTAEALGYPICKCSWPPTIMLRTKDKMFVCRQCAYKSSAIRHEAILLKQKGVNL